MVKHIGRYFKYSDERGTFEGLVNFGEWREINLITSDSGVKRGDHYHKETIELFIILEGEIKVNLRMVKDGKLIGNTKELFLKAGDVFVIEPYVNHTFFVIKDGKWINVLSKTIDPKQPDIHRIN